MYTLENCHHTWCSHVYFGLALCSFEDVYGNFLSSFQWPNISFILPSTILTFSNIEKMYWSIWIHENIFSSLLFHIDRNRSNVNRKCIDHLIESKIIGYFNSSSNCERPTFARIFKSTILILAFYTKKKCVWIFHSLVFIWFVSHHIKFFVRISIFFLFIYLLFNSFSFASSFTWRICFVPWLISFVL